MRTRFAVCLALVFATGMFAQNRGAQPVLRGTMPSVVYPGGTSAMPGVTRNFGSVVNPGGGGVHLVVPGAITDPTFGSRLAGTVNGQGVGRGNSGGRRFTTFIPYPVYIGGYYDTPYINTQPPMDYQYQPQQQPNITVIYPPQQATPVIINHYVPGASTDDPNAFVTPAIDTVAAAEPAHYLIAFQDHTIYSAVAYWVDGDTLHYFTAGNTHNQVSLSLVDRDLTTRLNKDSGVEVKLPVPKQ